MAIDLVVEQVKVAIVFFQGEEDGDGLAVCTDDVSRCLFAQRAGPVLAGGLAHTVHSL